MRLGIIAVGVLLAAIAIVFDRIALSRDLLEKSAPDLSMLGLMKTAICASSAGFLVYGVKPSAPDLRFTANDTTVGSVVVGVSILSQVIMGLSALSIIFAPAILNMMVNSEGSPFALLSETLLAAAVILLGLSAVRLGARKRGDIGVIPGALVVVLMSFVVFLIFMEEISWGQHIFDWATPETFSGNIQSETNLHNFYTNRFEVAYYISAIAAFVIIPFAWPEKSVDSLNDLSFYVPPRDFILAGIPISGFLYLSWNIAPLQIGLFVGLFVLLAMLILHWGDESRYSTVLTVLVCVFVLAQFVYLTMGDRLIHVHEVDELREFQISLMLFLYSGWLAWKATNVRTGAPT